MTRKEEIKGVANDQAQEFYGNLIKEDVSESCARMYKYIAFSYMQKGAEWADKTMIEKVCEFIRINAYKYRQLKFVKNKATFGFRTDRLIEDLRKTIEE